MIAAGSVNRNDLGTAYKNRANAYLEIAKGSTAPIETLSKKLEEAEFRNKAMQESLELLQSQVRAMNKADKNDLAAFRAA